MNTVLSSSGQLCGCPETLKKSCKFFCRGLDIRVTDVMHSYFFHPCLFCPALHLMVEIGFCDRKQSFVWLHIIKHFDIFLHFFTQERRHFDCVVALFCFRACDNVPPF